MSKPVEVGDIITIQLENIAYGGDVVGRKEGFAIFVAAGIPGELVKVEITEVKRNYGRGQLLEVISPVPERATAECNKYNTCGGCQLQHIDYQSQLEYKHQMVEDAMERIGKLEVEINPVLGMENPYLYRNKAQFPLGVEEEELVAGFYASGSHDLVAVDNCQIQHPVINRIAERTTDLLTEYDLAVYDEAEHKGLLRHVVIRVGVCTNQAMLIIVTNTEEFPGGEEIANKLLAEVPELVSVYQNVNSEDTNVVLGEQMVELAGQEQIIDYIGQVKYQISPRSFFQVNTLQTKTLYDQVVEYAELTGVEKVLDAYCGLGSIALYLAEQAQEVLGIEVIPEAIEQAQENAQLNGINNCQFKVGKVRDVLPELKEEFSPEVIVVDPPRKGCHEEVLAAFAEIQPERIVYVSCKPTSLARDLKRLQELGYQVEEIQPVDMFPQTYHIENVALIKKIDN
ncbi:23S rRNA (uracil(1939)-C(5))-methyltransferase RlmD [Halanaerobaculum tunisiense]